MDTKIPRPRPTVAKGVTVQIRVGCGNLYVTINEDGHGPCEVFVQIGKSGGCSTHAMQAIGRLMSIALRSGIDPLILIDQLKGIRCPSPTVSDVLSCSDGLAQVLEDYFKVKREDKNEMPEV